jgi:predicted transcriptional regulator
VNNPTRKSERREHFRIIAEILHFASDGAPKTQLMLKVKLSYTQLESYLPLLLKLELMKKTNLGKAILYETTEKGKSFLKNYNELNTLLKLH